MSVQRPTAHKSDLAAVVVMGVKSKQATSYSNVACLLKEERCFFKSDDFLSIK